MRHIVKYLLVIAVLVAGYHAASQFRSSAPQTTENAAQVDERVLSQHPDSQPRASTSPSHVPLAAIIDAEQVNARPADFDWPQVKRESTVEKLPRIDNSETTEDASAYLKRADAEEQESVQQWPSKKRPSSREKQNSTKRPTTRKEPRQGKKSGGLENQRLAAEAEAQTPKANKPRADDGATSMTATPRADVASDVTRGSKTTDRSSLFPLTQLDDDWPSSTWPPSRDELNADVPSSAKKALMPKKDDAPAKTAYNPHRHRIVDNDTLPKLAQTYFGDPRLYLDIFRANPDVLSDPRLLPIGVEITIPSRQARKSVGKKSGVEDEHVPSDQTKEGDMVPIPPYALPPRGTEHRSPFHTGHVDQSRFGV